MYKSFFVTGTDVDVGKTVVSVALMQALVKKSELTAGFKPIAVGSSQTLFGLKNTDALHLRENANIPLDYEEVNPYLYHADFTPHISAGIEGNEVDFKVLSQALKHLEMKARYTLVEGIGGWRVPVSHEQTLADWVSQEKLPIILVVGIKRGCINHAYLTMEAIQRDGLTVIGWVANRINPETEHYDDIIQTLEQHLKVPKLGEIPYLPNIKSRDLSAYVDVSLML